MEEQKEDHHLAASNSKAPRYLVILITILVLGAVVYGVLELFVSFESDSSTEVVSTPTPTSLPSSERSQFEPLPPDEITPEAAVN